MQRTADWAARLPTQFDRLRHHLTRAAQRQPSGYYTLWINGQPLGRLHGELGELVRRQSSTWTSRWDEADRQLHWTLPPETLTASMTELGVWLAHEGWVPNWRDETQTLYDATGQALGELERALFKVYGLRSQAVHLHVETCEGLIWAAVRSKLKKEHPGLLDNLCAGGVSSGETALQSAWRELDEEAGLSAQHFSGTDLQHLGSFEVSRALGTGWHLELCHLYFATMRAGVHPHNRDGEVSHFQLMTRSACAQAVNQNLFTPDAGLCCAIALGRAQIV